VMPQAHDYVCVEVCWLFAVMCTLMFLLSFLLAQNKPGTGGTAPVH
jgi:hypothetical protein